MAGGRWKGADDPFNPAPAVILRDQSRLVLTGDANTVLEGGSFGPRRAPAIGTYGGEIVRDPAPVLVPASSGPAISGPATVVSAPTPYLRAQVTSSTLTATLQPRISGQAYLLASPFVPPLPLWSPLPDFWVGAPVVLAAGTATPGVPRIDTIALPALVPGSSLPLQSVVVGGTLLVSNPVVKALAP
jgi:hypothetical protein